MHSRTARLSVGSKRRETTTASRDILPLSHYHSKIILPLRSADKIINSKSNNTQSIHAKLFEDIPNHDKTIHIVEDEHKQIIDIEKGMYSMKTTLRRNIATSQENNPLIVSNRKDKQILIMEKTNCKEFPTFEYKASYKQICLDSNKISTLPSLLNLEKLEILKLNQNCITSIPSHIKDLVSLKELHLCRNNIEKIDNDIGSLKELRVLLLSNNRLHAIPSSIGKLVKLRSVEMQGNYINSLPTSFSNLTFLERFGMEWFFYISRERIIIVDERNLDLLRNFKIICFKHKESEFIDFLTYFRETMAINDTQIQNVKYDSRGRNLLHMASINNHFTIAQSCFQFFDINSTDNEGATALLLALQYKCESIANLLLNHSANPCLSNSKYGSPLCIALSNEMLIVAEKMLNNDKINVNCKDINGNNPLHLIMRIYDKNEEIACKICTLLVNKYSCKLNEFNKCGFTPFLISVKKGNIEAVKFMLKHNKSNSARQFNVKECSMKEKMNALHYATLYSDIKMIQLLSNQGINLIERDCNNNKPLYYCNEINIKKYLLVHEKQYIADRFKNTYGLSKCTLNSTIKGITIKKNLLTAFCEAANESCFMDSYDMQEGIKNTANLEMYDYTNIHQGCQTERRISIQTIPFSTRGNSSVMQRAIRNHSNSPYENKNEESDKTNILSQATNLNIMSSIRRALRVSVQSPYANSRHQATPVGMVSNCSVNKLKVTVTENYVLNSINKEDYKNAVLSANMPCLKYKAVYSLFTKLDEIALLQSFNKVNSDVIKLDIIYLLSLLSSTKITHNDMQKCDLVKSKVKNNEILNCILNVNDGVPKYIVLFLLEYAQIKNRTSFRPICI